MPRCGFRLGNYVATIKSKSYQKVLQAIMESKTNPDELVKMVHGRTVNKHGRETINAAVTGLFSKTDIIAETGVDMKMFATAAALVGWCGLKPRNDVSNGRYKSRKVTHGNRYLRQILIEIAWVASRTRKCFFSNFSYIQTTVKKKSKMKIQVAIARKILVAVWHMLTKEEDFIDIYLKRLKQEKELEEKTQNLVEASSIT